MHPTARRRRRRSGLDVRVYNGRLDTDRNGRPDEAAPGAPDLHRGRGREARVRLLVREAAAGRSATTTRKRIRSPAPTRCTRSSEIHLTFRRRSVKRGRQADPLPRGPDEVRQEVDASRTTNEPYDGEPVTATHDVRCKKAEAEAEAEAGAGALEPSRPREQLLDVGVGDALGGVGLDEQGRGAARARPRSCSARRASRRSRPPARSPRVLVDRLELPVRRAEDRPAVEGEHRQLVVGQVEQQRQVLVRLLLPAGRPDELEASRPAGAGARPPPSEMQCAIPSTQWNCPGGTPRRGIRTG